MKKEKQNFREEWQTMPDEDLRDIYKKKLRIQKMLAGFTWLPLLPAAVIYGVCGWAGFIASEYTLFRSISDGGASSFLFFAAFAACGALMMSRNQKSFFVIPFVMIAGILFKMNVYGGSSLIGVLMLAYVIAACIAQYFVVSDLNFLRELPNFPFAKRRDEINFNAMNRDVMLRYLETAQNGGITTVKGEEVFTAEKPEEIVKPPEKTEEYLQQHKMMYKNRKLDRWL